MEIIGREQEQAVLRMCYDSGKPEFVAVYGRRRIGKTFLVRQYFKDQFDFYTTGIYEGTHEEQLTVFCKRLNVHSGGVFPIVNNWFDAFDQLQTYLSGLRKRRIVVFIDELPWLDTPKSRFTKALELFWNSWGCQQERLMLVVCGSATTWMTKKLIGDKGGLHNRLTRSLRLQPFTLRESEQMLRSQNVRFDRYQLLENYMIMGGTPYYLSLLQPGMSLSQNIDNLFFSADAPLRREYDFLLRSLFNDSAMYRNIIETIGQKAKGLTLKEIKEALRLPDGGKLTEVLNNLCNCDFLTKYYAFGKKQRDALFQLTDLYTLFYLRFIKDHNGHDEHQWSNMTDNPRRTAWSGYAFEQVCLHHIPQIKQRLGIAGVLTEVCSWNYAGEGQREQIDLLIDRRDHVVNLCEMKYSRGRYELTRAYTEHLNDRLESFRLHTGTTKALHLTMVTTYGLKPSQYNGFVQSEVTMDDLFA